MRPRSRSEEAQPCLATSAYHRSEEAQPCFALRPKLPHKVRATPGETACSVREPMPRAPYARLSGVYRVLSTGNRTAHRLLPCVHQAMTSGCCTIG